MSRVVVGEGVGPAGSPPAAETAASRLVELLVFHRNLRASDGPGVGVHGDWPVGRCVMPRRRTRSRRSKQNAVIEMSRQVRYIDNPVPKGVGQPAILWASPDRDGLLLAVGIGRIDRLAYKVMLCNSDLGVESFVWAPTLENNDASFPSSVDSVPNTMVPPCSDDAATHWEYVVDGTTMTKPVQRRLLVGKDNLSDPQVAFRFFEGDVEIQKLDQGVSLSLDELDRITRVEIVLTSPSLGAPLEQSVLLVNER